MTLWLLADSDHWYVGLDELGAEETILDYFQYTQWITHRWSHTYGSVNLAQMWTQYLALAQRESVSMNTPLRWESIESV